ncbi:uncharacterized protein LOC113975879 [Neopelma chrysocephalum]|uniref:uncharacterized protein LOC113975879 n=1 Tax=Neopelma chrysocephalum TaxID=114329 RepID=UPI000FCD174D|nr:uncharacterized protein LOC113975879 [Neopelma chrysocephalum]
MAMAAWRPLATLLWCACPWQPSLAPGSCSMLALPSKCPSTAPALPLPHLPAPGTPLVRGRVPWALAEPWLRGGGRDGHDALATAGGWLGLGLLQGNRRHLLSHCARGRISSTPQKLRGSMGYPESFPVEGALQALKLPSHGTHSRPRLSPVFFSPACGSAAEGPVLGFMSPEQGLSLHGLNFSFAAVFLSPNDLTGSSCQFSVGLWVTLRTAVQDSLLRIWTIRKIPEHSLEAWALLWGIGNGQLPSTSASSPWPFPQVGGFHSWEQSGEGWVPLKTVPWAWRWLLCALILVGLFPPLLMKILGYHRELQDGGNTAQHVPHWAESAAHHPPRAPGRVMGWVQVLGESKYSGKQRVGFPQGLH